METVQITSSCRNCWEMASVAEFVERWFAARLEDKRDTAHPRSTLIRSSVGLVGAVHHQLLSYEYGPAHNHKVQELLGYALWMGLRAGENFVV